MNWPKAFTLSAAIAGFVVLVLFAPEPFWWVAGFLVFVLLVGAS